MTNISLSFEEGMLAAMQGCIQQMRAVQTGRVGNDHGGFSGRDIRERWAQTIHGQMCEHAVAKAIGVFPEASINGIVGDDPGGLAIRGTPWSNGCLIVNEREIARCHDKKFVLVVGHWPAFRIAGWIIGHEANRDEFWRPDEKPASWWVPQDALHPFSEMPLPQREIPQ